MNSYVFILCPPYSGSTLLWRLVSTSDAVSSLPKEGQVLPEVREIMRQEPWNTETKFPWEMIKKVWDGYWDHSKPLLLEKSPPHIIRTHEIEAHFKPLYFLLMVRNPYAHCEGLIRRNHWSAQKAVNFTVRCMKQQMENAQKLDNALCFTYEELVCDPEQISEKIQSFLPEIGKLKHADSFQVRSIDGVVARGIVDLNRKKINNLPARKIRVITNTLKKNSDVMDYWKYEYIEPSVQHTINYLKTKTKQALSAINPNRIKAKLRKKLRPK